MAHHPSPGDETDAAGRREHDARDMVAKKRRPPVPATGGGFGKRQGMLRDGGAGE